MFLQQASVPNVIFFLEKKRVRPFFSPDRGDCRSREMLQKLNEYVDAKLSLLRYSREQAPTSLLYDQRSRALIRDRFCLWAVVTGRLPGFSDVYGQRIVHDCSHVYPFVRKSGRALDVVPQYGLGVHSGYSLFLGRNS